MSKEKTYWRAECQTCPTTLNKEYGYDEKVSFEHADEKEVDRWVSAHMDSHLKYGITHLVNVTKVVSWTVKDIDLNTDLLKKLFKP